MRTRQRGFSIVEMMVAVAIAMVTGLVVITVLGSFQARKLTTSGENDAVVNASLAMFSVEREVRMAGAGLTNPNGMACNQGINISYNGTTASNAAPLMALRIVDGAGAPDTLQVIRSSATQGPAPITLLQAMASPTDTLVVDNQQNIVAGHVLLVGAVDGTKICTLMQVTQAPASSTGGTSWNLVHASGVSGYYYNPATPATAFTTAMSYAQSDQAVDLGTYGVRRYSVVCNDGNAPSATNNCDLGYYDALATALPLTVAKIQSVAPQIIEMQAQYGIAAAAGSQTVASWVDATGTWAAPTAANVNLIKAVRIAIVARGHHEGKIVSPTQLVLWDAGLPTQRVRALSAAEQQYRYQVLTVIIPLMNVIWAGV